MSRTTPNDLPLVPQALSGSDERGGQVIQIGTAHIAQLNPFEVIPDALLLEIDQLSQQVRYADACAHAWRS